MRILRLITTPSLALLIRRLPGDKMNFYKLNILWIRKKRRYVVALAKLEEEKGNKKRLQDFQRNLLLLENKTGYA